MRKFLFVLLIIGCKPKRDNPYDPLSPNYPPKGIIKGKVITAVGTPLKEAIVTTVPIKYATKTDANGYFNLKIEAGDWKILAKKENYKPETTKVKIENKEEKEINFLLNGIPYFDTAYVISWQENVGVGSKFWVEIFAKINDMDGVQDIDSVIVAVDSDTGKIQKRLTYQNDVYFTKIHNYELPNRNLEQLIGSPFIVYAKDKKGLEKKSTPFYLVRIIYQIPWPIKPATNDTFSQASPIEFIWNRPLVVHKITYTLLILDAAYDTIIVRENLTDTTKNEQLLPGDYFWRAIIKDDFGNASACRLVPFTVK